MRLRIIKSWHAELKSPAISDINPELGAGVGEARGRTQLTKRGKKKGDVQREEKLWRGGEYRIQDASLQARPRWLVPKNNTHSKPSASVKTVSHRLEESLSLHVPSLTSEHTL